MCDGLTGTECASVSSPLTTIVVLIIARIVVVLMALAEYPFEIASGGLEHAACSSKPEDFSGYLQCLPG